MTPSVSDPTAGERARAICEHPEIPQPVVDPTDPNLGAVSPRSQGATGEARQIVDPTDPGCGARAA
jgi:hypothetical protein